MTDPRIENILNFWFGPLLDNHVFPDEKSKMWFRGGEEVNRSIRQKFERDFLSACQGGLDHWKLSPRGRLALIILLDQFSRNLYEDRRAFLQDEKALRLCLEGISFGQDKRLLIVERTFFYMPLQHSEKIEIQQKSVYFFEQLKDQASPAIDLPIGVALDYAKRHAEIIQRFGRFPHRNEVLGRQTTPDEAEFLLEPNSSF